MAMTTAPAEVGRPSGPPALAAFASIGAGAIHATAAGMHNDHRQALWAFVAVALLQIGWGALALVRAGATVATLGVVGNGVALGGWMLAKTRGIDFIDGLEAAEDLRLGDAVAAGLAGTAVLTAALGGLRQPRWARRLGPSLVHGVAPVVVAVTVTGMIAAGGHSHAGEEAIGGGRSHAHGDEAAGGEEPAEPPRPFDPTQPIDLSGVEGVTPEQQARAENLLAVTLARLPRWSDPAVAEANGYHSIGDAATGHEHLINWTLLGDGRVLDPDLPESLVYRVDGAGNRTLVAAMFMLEPGSTLDTVPDLGGPLTQFHIHDNLCFTDDPVAPQVRGVIASGGECQPPTVMLEPVPMIHVWIVSHRCGPFAALDGVGAGRIAEGEERLCDHAHGSS